MNSNLSYSLETLNSRGSNRRFFVPYVWPWNLTNDLEKEYGASSFVHQFIVIGEFKLELQSGNAQFRSKPAIFCPVCFVFCGASSFVHHFIAINVFKLELQSENYQFGSKSVIFFVLCDLQIWRMTMKNNRTSLLYYVKLCLSFESHWRIQIWVTVPKRLIWVTIGDFFVPCDLEMWWMTFKTIGHLFYTTLRFASHFKSVKSNLCYSPETLNSGQNQRFSVPCDLKIWRIILKNKRAPLLCCFKHCASFHSQQCIQTGVTVRKHPIWVKIDDLFSCVTLKCGGWHWKTIGHLSCATSCFVHHFILICEFKVELWSGNG